MKRDEILALVVRHICEAGEDLTALDIDPARSMKDYDLSSLDIVEVVSRSMQALRVKLPRQGLLSLRTIDGLVDLLHQTIATRTNERLVDGP